MSFNEMALPIDIPWKRMGVAKDMIDKKYGDLKFPEKWRSSMAVFYYEPAESPQDYCDRKITYLKIVCTITNTQLPRKKPAKSEEQDVSILDELREVYTDFDAYKRFERRITNSFPCYGALLQVGVYPYPNQENVELYDYPYIAAYQPRKREMYETVSESGEFLSQSGTNINLSKGSTNTNSTERYDLELGGKEGVSLGILGTWGYEKRPQQKGWIKKDEIQKQQVTTIDSSREKRESVSYSTTINQLYTLLQSYHLGTNRAIFFIQPRPHIQDAKFTFIRGLRRLEGIQEFFLIINRPASVKGLCVELSLETAHLFAKRAFSPRLVTESVAKSPENLDKTADAIGDEGISLEDLFSTDFDLVRAWNTMSAWARMLAIGYANQINWVGWQFMEKRFDSGSIDREHWNKAIHVVYKIPDIQCGEDIGILFDEYESTTGDMFLTGRRLCVCMHPEEEGEEIEEEGEEPEDQDESPCQGEKSTKVHISNCEEGPSILYEKQLYMTINSSPYLATNRPYSHSLYMNTFIDKINRELESSIGSPNRRNYGEISFLETNFALREMSQLLRIVNKLGAKDIELGKVDSMKSFLNRGFGNVSKVKNLFDITSISKRDIAKDLEVTEIEAAKEKKILLKSALLSVDLEEINTSKKINPIMEHIAFEFPKERFQKLRRSALLKKD